MARIRTIKPQFFTSEDVTAQPPLARLLFVGLFTEADRDGRVEDRPRQLKTRLLPEDECDVDALLWGLVDGGLIRRYEADGVAVIQIRAFPKHQKPHPKEADSILPKDGTDRERPHLNTESREEVNRLPVENPSSPAITLREGKEYQEGKGREGDGVPPPLISGESSPKGWGKIHGEHVPGFCDWVCLPEFLFNEFCRKSGRPTLTEGPAYVRQWAATVRQLWSGPVGDNLKFWRARWDSSHPQAVSKSNKPRPIEEILAERERKSS